MHTITFAACAFGAPYHAKHAAVLQGRDGAGAGIAAVAAEYVPALAAAIADGTIFIISIHLIPCSSSLRTAPRGTYRAGTMMARALLLLSLSVLSTRAVELPSCESDTDAHCVGEGADLSNEGINACLQALGAKRSERCTSYLRVITACSSDLEGEGVCASAAMDGESIPCLVQRVKPEQLSESCRTALPKDELKGERLALFWKNGKRILDINEIAELNADDKDTYNRWKKKKGGAKSAKAKERDYAIKTQKKEQTVKQVTQAVVDALANDELTIDAATKFVRQESKAAVENDMTGTLKPFTKGEIAGIAKEALAQAKKAKEEL
ncbi:hypothetical protein AB1Y20_009951 [Prymnesium parvum]|uniref:Uncharacterized protein n=1 Tax=Prymnesium parvum TaxID=97485 RepID=A0AB34K5Z0_PRYPA